MDLAARAEAGDAAEDRNALHFVLIVQKGQNLLHQRLAVSMIRFAEIDADHSTSFPSDPPVIDF